MTSLKTSIKTITYLSDIGCLEIQGASLDNHHQLSSYWTWNDVDAVKLVDVLYVVANA
ncbi:hypothetical protein VEE71_43290 [Escherichia coli]|nr:hypothetical protein VEGS02_43480 [Escherichia coli]BED15606.1 hypothetical protein VEE71_43290 [Escherichia coli]